MGCEKNEILMYHIGFELITIKLRTYTPIIVCNRLVNLCSNHIL